MNSYPKVYNIGHPEVADLFSGPVVVQEKVDGSQLSFELPADGEVPVFRSRGATIDLGAVPDLFRPAIETVCGLAGVLEPGWVYRAEAVCRPRHNTLTYERVPRGGLVLFDVMQGEERYIQPDIVASHATALGLEYVPTFFRGEIVSVDEIRSHMDRVSFLGGPKIEGVVVKNYDRFGRDGKPLFGKYVSEAFKEKHSKQWRADNPSRGDVVEQISEALRTEARWKKSVQHMAERGQLQNAPEDIGPLLQAIKDDILEEETDFIKQKLFDYAQRKILGGATKGFPQWYKDQLLEGAFK